LAADTSYVSLRSHSGHGDRADTVTVSSGVWLRNRRRTHAWAAICAGWSVLFASLILIPGRLPAHGHTSELIAVLAFYLGTGAVGLALARRIGRAGVRLEADGIVVRGPFRTHSVPLDDAGRFTPGLQGRGGNGVPCPMLSRSGGAAAGIWALGQRNVWFRYARIRDELQPLCDELNELLDAMRS
jgi:hypothetical protein